MGERRRHGNKFRSRLGRGCGVLMCAATSFLMAMSAAASGIELHLTLDRQAVTLHEPVVANLSIRNSSAGHMRLNLGTNGNQYVGVWIKHPSGEQSSVGGLPAPEGFAAVVNVPLGPGDTHTQQLILDAWHSFDAAGEYELMANLEAAAVADTDAPQSLVSEKVQLTVTPRNAKQLSDRAKILLADVLGAPNLAQAAEKATVLSYFVDPIAVPALTQLLAQNDLIRAIAIDGLIRIGSEESVAALEDNLGRYGDDGDSVLRMGLYRIAHSAADPVTRSRAQAVIDR